MKKSILFIVPLLILSLSFATTFVTIAQAETKACSCGEACKCPAGECKCAEGCKCGEACKCPAGECKCADGCKCPSCKCPCGEACKCPAGECKCADGCKCPKDTAKPCCPAGKSCPQKNAA